MKNVQVFACPSYARTDRMMSGQAAPGGGTYQAVPRSYGFNFELNTQKLASVSFPAELIAITETQSCCRDTREQCCAPGYVAPGPRSGCCATNAPWGHVATRHSEGANRTFLDGHAKWLKRRGDVDGNNCSSRWWRVGG